MFVATTTHYTAMSQTFSFTEMDQALNALGASNNNTTFAPTDAHVGIPFWAQQILVNQARIQHSIDHLRVETKARFEQTARSRKYVALCKIISADAVLYPLPATNPQYCGQMPPSDLFPATVGQSWELTHEKLDKLQEFYGELFEGGEDLQARNYRFRSFIKN